MDLINKNQILNQRSKINLKSNSSAKSKIAKIVFTSVLSDSYYLCTVISNISLYIVLLLDFDECSLSPCQHGSCTDHVNAYTCACPLPWIGTNCETGTVYCHY